MALSVILAVAGGTLNLALASLVGAFEVPLYLDSILTIVVTIHLGLGYGVITALVTNGLLALTGQTLFAFVCCSVATAIIAHLFVRRDALRDHTGYIWMGLAVALANGVLGSVLAYFIFGGVTEVHGIDRLVVAIAAAGEALVTSVFWAGLLTNLIDKLLSSIVAFFLRGPVGTLFDESMLSGERVE